MTSLLGAGATKHICDHTHQWCRLWSEGAWNFQPEKTSETLVFHLVLSDSRMASWSAFEIAFNILFSIWKISNFWAASLSQRIFLCRNYNSTAVCEKSKQWKHSFLGVRWSTSRLRPWKREKLTLGKMNCSTGLYHTPFTMVPVLMALKRAVTTASCKKKKKSQAFILQAIGYVSISSTLNTTVQTVILKTSNLKGLHAYKWGSKQ